MIDLRESGRILYISSVDVSVGNGPGVNEREFILCLHRHLGDRVHFLIPQPIEEISELPLERCTFCQPHQRHHPLYFPFHVGSQLKQADRLLCDRQFDLLVFRLDVLPFAPLRITQKYQIPYTIKTLGQGMMNALAESGGLLGKSLMSFHQTWVKTLVKNALVNDSVSVAQVEYLQKILALDAPNLVWIDNAVNTDRFFPISTADARSQLHLDRFDPIIGYIGTRPWERGGMQLVEVSPRLLKKYPNLGLVILGDGAKLNELKQLARQLKIEDRCQFVGYIPFQQVPLYVNSLDVGISISLRADRYAASELKVRQYLACGKPVVVSPGSNDFIVQEKLGSIVSPTNLDEIERELDRWLSLTISDCDRFSQKTVEYVRDFLSIDAAVLRRLDLWSAKLSDHLNDRLKLQNTVASKEI